MSSGSLEKQEIPAEMPSHVNAIDLSSFHEKQAGRLVMELEEAKIEFGEAFASRLKLSPDGTKILWPQPHDSELDPQNWSAARKSLLLIIVTLAAIVPDFDAGIGKKCVRVLSSKLIPFLGIAGVFALADQYKSTPGGITNLTSNWSIFLLGWGGVISIVFVKRYGRLPVLFWTQVLALGFLIGATFAPTLKTFAAMRCLTAFFGTAPQVTGLYVVTDLYPFHLQARKLNIWTMGFVISPFLSPFALGFLDARQNWRWSYGIGCVYSALVVLLIVFFMEETMYDRTIKPVPPRPTTGFHYRIETLVGITGVKMAKYRDGWAVAFTSSFRVVWRPHALSILIFEGVLFGFGIGMNVTNAVFLGLPGPVGYELDATIIAGLYATPIVRYFCLPRFLGLTVDLSHLGLAALIMGWGITELAIMINTVAVYAYLNDCFPKHQMTTQNFETLNTLRFVGFAVAYFQVPWAAKNGALQTFGVEAA
ncbi:hypothetical protein C0991_008512 [Blastosporella zonata]|nr:hypothetical protein C0991_008512 [Blastosporella zonata]